MYVIKRWEGKEKPLEKGYVVKQATEALKRGTVLGLLESSPIIFGTILALIFTSIMPAFFGIMIWGNIAGYSFLYSHYSPLFWSKYKRKEWFVCYYNNELVGRVGLLINEKNKIVNPHSALVKEGHTEKGLFTAMLFAAAQWLEKHNDPKNPYKLIIVPLGHHKASMHIKKEGIEELKKEEEKLGVRELKDKEEKIEKKARRFRFFKSLRVFSIGKPMVVGSEQFRSSIKFLWGKLIGKEADIWIELDNERYPIKDLVV